MIFLFYFIALNLRMIFVLKQKGVSVYLRFSEMVSSALEWPSGHFCLFSSENTLNIKDNISKVNET